MRFKSLAITAGVVLLMVLASPVVEGAKEARLEPMCHFTGHESDVLVGLPDVISMPSSSCNFYGGFIINITCEAALKGHRAIEAMGVC